MNQVFLSFVSFFALTATASVAAAPLPGAPHVATAAGVVYVAWTDLTPLGFDVFLRRSVDGGATFEPPINVSRNAGSAYDVALAADGDVVAIAWVDDTPGNRDVFVTASRDRGLTFDDPLNVSADADYSGDAAVAVDGGRVHVSWTLTRLAAWPSSDVLFRSSVDAGRTFGPTTNLTGTPETESIESRVPQIVTSGETVYVGYSQGDLVMRASHDGGTTFGPPVPLGVRDGRIAARDDLFVVAGAAPNGPSWEFFARESPDRGATFTAPEQLTPPDGAYRIVYDPRLVLSETGLAVAWRQLVGDARDLVIRARPAGAAAFGPARTARELRSAPSSAGAYALAATASGPVVLWDERSAGWGSLLLARSDDGGVTFRTAVVVASSQPSDPSLEILFESSQPALAASGSRVHAAYLAHMLPGPTLLLRASQDGGATFAGHVALNAAPLPGPAAGTVYEARYDFVDPDTIGPDPAVWSPSGTGVQTLGVPGLGWGMADFDYSSSLLYSNSTPLMEDPHAVLVLRARSTSQYEDSGSSAWSSEHLGWRLVIEAGNGRAEILHSRTTTGAEQLVLDGVALVPPMSFPFGNGLEHEYEIRRLCCTGEVVVIATQGDPNWQLRVAARRYAGELLPWHTGGARFAWGMGREGGGAAYWRSVEARVLKPGATLAECKAQIDLLIAQTTAAQITGRQAEKDRSALLSKLADAKAKLDGGKPLEAVAKLTDFRDRVQALLAAGKIEPAQAGVLLDGAAIAIASAASLPA